MSILIPRSNKGPLIDRLKALLEEALFPGIGSQMRSTIQTILTQIARAPDDINVKCSFQVIPELRTLQIVLEIVDVAGPITSKN